MKKNQKGLSICAMPVPVHMPAHSVKAELQTGGPSHGNIQQTVSTKNWLQHAKLSLHRLTNQAIRLFLTSP